MTAHALSSTANSTEGLCAVTDRAYMVDAGAFPPNLSGLTGQIGTPNTYNLQITKHKGDQYGDQTAGDGDAPGYR